MARTWVTLPTFNEAGNVEPIVRAIVAELDRVCPGDYRVLVVDDESPDGTGLIADRLAAELAAVAVLHRRGKRGLGHAYLAGFSRAVDEGAERVVVMDADFSHAPRHLPALLAASEHSDLVLGSRYVAGGTIVNWPRLRRLLSRAGSLYARTILGVGVRDLTGGFRCIRREVLETVGVRTLRSQGYVFNIELTYRALKAGIPRRRGPDHVPRPDRRREQDLARDRGRGSVAGPGAAVPLARSAVACEHLDGRRPAGGSCAASRPGPGARSVRPVPLTVTEQARQRP